MNVPSDKNLESSENPENKHDNADSVLVSSSQENADDEVEALSDELATEDADDSDSPKTRPFDNLQPVELSLSTAEGLENVKNVEKFATFEEANLHPQLLAGIAKMGWTKPTPVQSLCLPYSTSGRDVAGFAQTGTGKTGVFLITAAQRLLAATTADATAAKAAKGDIARPRCVVLAPTRELAVQIDQDAEGFFALLGITHMAVYGGIDWDKQAKKLREGVDVIVATPGRLKDYYQKKIVTLDDCSVFVCDEADRMFDMGFIEDVQYFLDKLPEQTQKLLFSATTNAEVKELAFEYLNKPAYISVNPEVITPERIDQRAIICDAPNKLKVMLGLFRDLNPDCAIVFTNTKLTAEWLHFKLVHNGIEADLITGDLPQKKRINLITRIKEGKVKALIATDVASRGLHISRVTHVFNFDLPDEPANYVHRIGRTARAGASGSAISLVCDDYGQNLAAVKDMLGDKIPLRSEWFDDRYLSIEDKAGNPFAEMLKRSERPNDQYRRDKPQRGAQRGERHDRQKQRGERPQNNYQTNNRRPDGRRDQGRGRGAPKELHPRQSQFPSRHTSSAALQPAGSSAPTGFFALLKRLFSALFGKK